MIKSIKYFKNEFYLKQNSVLIENENESYVENFGKQWKTYRDVQIDSLNNFKISYKFLNQMFFNDLNKLQGKQILELGCGAGRFTEYLTKYAKECVSIDLSSAVFHNVAKSSTNLTLIKADFNKLIPNEKFDIVFCRGVLQHTPNPLKSIKNIHSFVRENGDVYFDIYKNPKIGFLHPKYLFWRPLIQKLFSYDQFEKYLNNNIKFLLKTKRFIKNIFLNSDFISDSIIPIWDYKNKLNLNEEQLANWSIMDTLDGLYATYDLPQTKNKILKFLADNNIEAIEINEKKNIYHTRIK